MRCKKVNTQYTINDWELAHVICELIRSKLPDLKSDLVDYLERYKTQMPKDKFLKDRVEFLIKYLGLDINKN